MNKEILEFVGKRVKQLRLKNELTQETLAHLCETDASYIRKVESGKLNTSVKRLNVIAQNLNLSMSDFFAHWPDSLDAVISVEE